MTKIQFYAIELARNREGHNDKIRGKFKPKIRGPKKQALNKNSMQLSWPEIEKNITTKFMKNSNQRFMVQRSKQLNNPVTI